ncbi:MAG TPA: HAMP domain-containing sensor histidine kinase [Polyangia bacterium]|jgi:two-component system sensor histidine kinase ChvG
MPLRPLRRPPARSLYFRLLQLGLALVLLPSLLIAIASIYEHFASRAQMERLARVPFMIHGWDLPALEQVAPREGVVIAVLDIHGGLVRRTGSVPLAHSAIGGVGEKIVGEPGGQTLDQADAQLPPWLARAEVQAALGGNHTFGRHLTPDGSAMLLTLATPNPDGGVLYILSGSHRGIRRLVLVRRQLMELIVYEIVLALPIVVLFAVGLVRPLERLSAAARRYPAEPLADPKLYARKDEIGALARTLTEMAEDLDARRRAAAELGADIAHEFKNPLATIAASGELLVTSPALTRERVELVARSINESVERLRRSIDDLMGLLRLEHAIEAEPREPVAMGAFLEELAGEYRRDARAAGWTFAVDATPAAAAAAPVINRRRWQEMLRNLIDNALVQPAAERRIELFARIEKDTLVTSVRDAGPGISADNQGKIFRRFFTQRPPGAAPGTGLGLSIVESVAHAHGARVEVESQPGQGATFRVVLPL